MQEYRKPPCDLRQKPIGKGGNGCVYLLDGRRKTTCVVKVFMVDKPISKEKLTRRYKRFCKEVVTQHKLGNEIDGVLPVIDYCINDDYSKEYPSWFVMPRAEKFQVHRNENIENKLYQMKELGKIIQKLHIFKIAHRDIKPSNILLVNNKIYLSDFGLVWLDEEEHITLRGEKVGPSRIIPPELCEIDELARCDYRKSDVYLFAKVLWMYIKGDRFGFYGPYYRCASQIVLSCHEYEINTFEPLHELMEKATKDNWQERIDIGECLRLIEHQIMIINGTSESELLDKYRRREILNKIDASVKPNYNVFSEPETMQLVLKEIIPGIQIIFDIEMQVICIRPYKVKQLSSSIFVFYQAQMGERVEKTAIHLDRIEKHSEKLVLVINKLSKEEKTSITEAGFETLDYDATGVINIQIFDS